MSAVFRQARQFMENTDLFTEAHDPLLFSNKSWLPVIRYTIQKMQRNCGSHSRRHRVGSSVVRWGGHPKGDNKFVEPPLSEFDISIDIVQMNEMLRESNLILEDDKRSSFLILIFKCFFHDSQNRCLIFCVSLSACVVPPAFLQDEVDEEPPSKKKKKEHLQVPKTQLKTLPSAEELLGPEESNRLSSKTFWIPLLFHVVCSGGDSRASFADDNAVQQAVVDVLALNKKFKAGNDILEKARKEAAKDAASGAAKCKFCQTVHSSMAALRKHLLLCHERKKQYKEGDETAVSLLSALYCTCHTKDYFPPSCLLSRIN